MGWAQGMNGKDKDMKRVGLYVRVSTDQQTGEAQEHELRQYLKTHSIRKVKWYRDKVTGKEIKRPALDKLQADIAAGKIGCVIVWKLDRLARGLVRESFGDRHPPQRNPLGLMADRIEDPNIGYDGWNRVLHKWHRPETPPFGIDHPHSR